MQVGRRRIKEMSKMELNELLWNIIRAEGILVTNQNIDWLIGRVYKEVGR